MKVVWLGLEWPRHNFHTGGVGRYIQRLAEQMRTEVDLSVVAFADAVPMDGVTMIPIASPRNRLDRYYGTALRARSVLSALRPDLIHSHGDDFALTSSTPIVRSFYGSSLNEARSSSGLRKINHYMLAATERRSARNASVRLGIAPESVARFSCDLTFPPYLRDRSGPQSGAPSSDPLVVFIGSFEGRKRGFIAENAVGELRGSGQQVRLVVIGPATDKDSWAPWVEHHAGLTDAEVSTFLTQAWVLASPSAYEGFGIPIVEGLAHGNTVIASKNPGSDYLTNLAEPEAPLIVSDDSGFSTALRQAIANGPVLKPSASSAAARLVAAVEELGSPARLRSVYQDAVGVAAR